MRISLHKIQRVHNIGRAIAAYFCLIRKDNGIFHISGHNFPQHKLAVFTTVNHFVVSIVFVLVLIGCNSTHNSENRTPKISKEFKNGQLDKEYIYKNQMLKKIIYHDGFYESSTVKLNSDGKVAEVRYKREDPANKWRKKVSIWKYTYEKGQKKTATFSINAQRFSKIITEISYDYPDEKTVVVAVNELSKGNKENSKTLIFHFDEKGNPIKKKIDYIENHRFKPDYYMEYTYDENPSPAYLINQSAPGYFIEPISKNNVTQLMRFEIFDDGRKKKNTVTYKCQYNAVGLLASYSSSGLNYISTYQYLN